MKQLSMFNFLNEEYKIPKGKKLRLISLFSGYDSQALALKYANIPFEHYRTCEWTVSSIQALKDIHFENDTNDYSNGKTFEEIVAFLLYKGISIDYNNPMTQEQINRKGEKWVRKVYNNIIATKNLVNVSNVCGNDLEIEETDKYEYLLTYSFPCQDLSLAGTQKGMNKNDKTRSALLWEVERILKECKNLPNILLMENVPQVLSVKNVKDFVEWQKELESLGYKNYFEQLNAKDYGIPQNRNRVFMISVLGDYFYDFPQKQKLKLKIKDLLEEEVDEKYYLSDKMVQYIMADNEKWTGNNNKSLINKTIASTINTAEGSRRCDASNYIANDLPENTNLKEYGFGNKSLNKPLEVVVDKIPIKNKTKQGYLEATDGDGIDISSRMKHHRGTVQKGMCQALTTCGGNERGVVVKERGGNVPIIKESLWTKTQAKMINKDGNIKRYIDSKVVDEFKEGQCADISFPNGYNKGPRVHEHVPAINATTTISSFCVKTKDKQDALYHLRIRKLTPKECWRLMGVKDEDFEKVRKHQTNVQLYHLAGDSIVTNVLVEIFKKLVN